MAESIGLDPTSSTLLYLFADRLIPEKKFRTIGVEVPCKNVQVQLEELSGSLFAAAFWSLREQGVVGLEAFRARRMLVIPTTRVRVSRLGQAERPGLEGEILKTLDDKRDDHVYDLIRRWFGSDSSSPGWDVLQVAVQEAVDLGYIDRVEVDKGRGAVTGFFLGKSEIKLEPHCEKISTLEERFNDFASRWQTFQTSEAALYGTLMDQCKKAINSRTESDNDYDSDFSD